MATIGQATSRHRDREPASGQAVGVQLTVQGWAITRPRHAGPPDDPCNSLDPAA
jgi:hypothetical protein